MPRGQKWLIQIYQIILQCQKVTQFFLKLFSCNNIELEEQPLELTFFDNFKFFTALFGKNRPNVRQLGITPFQKTLKFL